MEKEIMQATYNHLQQEVNNLNADLIMALKIQFEEMTEMGTLEEYLKECGFEIKDDFIIPKNEIIGFEKTSVHIN